jgi:acyl dehydratase
MNGNPSKAFADIEIGDDIGPVTQTVTAEIVQHYADVVGIGDRRFIDLTVAREKGFNQPIVPGPLSATLLSKLLIDHFPGWRLQTFQVSFRTPVRHGDTLNFWGNVTEKSGDEADSTAAIHCDVVVENQHGDRVIVSTATLGPRGRISN